MHDPNLVFASMNPDPVQDVIIALFLLGILFLVPVCLYAYMILFAPKTETLLYHSTASINDNGQGNDEFGKCATAHLAWRDVKLTVETKVPHDKSRLSRQESELKSRKKVFPAISHAHGDSPDTEHLIAKQRPNSGKSVTSYMSTQSHVVVDKPLLKGISGYAKAGTLTCIMGHSGCGKTTLLDILASRHPSDRISGQIIVNAKSRSQRYMKRISAYVLQNDVLFSHLTVREVLLYTVELRIDKSVSAEEKLRRVEQVMRDLELIHVSNTPIGGEDARSGGLSGGQKRRLSIAMELVTFPSVLFLDEPTTGLDAYSSLRLVMTLRRLADKNRTVICTINQPRSDIFELFDNLLLLKNGATVYFGPITGIRRYFASQDMPIPHDANVADFVVDLTYEGEEDTDIHSRYWSENRHSEGEEDGKKVEEGDDFLVRAYRDSALKEEMDKELEKVWAIEGPELFLKEEGNEHKIVRYPNSVFKQVHILARRSMTNILRSRGGLITSWTLSISNILLYGLLYLGLKTSSTYVSTDLTYVQSQRAFMFQIVSGVCLLELDVLARAWQEKNIFFREHASGAYSTPSQHIHLFLRLTFMGLVKGLLYTPVCYFLSGLTVSWDKILYFGIVVSLMSTTGSSIAVLLMSAIPALEGAASAYSAIIGTMATFCGFFFLPDLIPPWFIYSYYMSYYKYAMEGLYWNEFWGRDVKWVSNVNGVTTHREILEMLEVDASLNRWGNLIVMLMFPIIFHFLAYLATALHVGAKKRNSKLRIVLRFVKRWGRSSMGIFKKKRRKVAPMTVYESVDEGTQTTQVKSEGTQTGGMIAKSAPYDHVAAMNSNVIGNADYIPQLPPKSTTLPFNPSVSLTASQIPTMTMIEHSERDRNIVSKGSKIE